MDPEVTVYQEVAAVNGDTLCGIAARYGFVNCSRLRQVEGNRRYRNNPLRAGDTVLVPIREVRTEDGRRVEQRHEYRRHGIPAPSIRFVREAAVLPWFRDDDLSCLNITNYITNKAGRNGQESFPTGYGYQGDARVDPDTFKIEVVDPGASGNTSEVILEALKPRYGADGRIERDARGNPVHENFASADPDAGSRRIAVACQRGNALNRARFRSRYLRLVTDDSDFAALTSNTADGTAQALLITDMADGNNGANDRVEILDQLVRATYVLQSCNSPAGQMRCKVVAELPVGEQRRRIRLCVHVFRESVGGANAGNLTEQMIRRRTMKWFRRAFAQINMAPEFVPCRHGSGPIEFLDPPANNMITISQDHGNPSSGVPVAAGAAGPPAPSQITFRLETLGAPPVAAQDVSVTITPGLTPEQVGTAIAHAVASLPGGAFGPQQFTNARTWTAANGSCDVIIRRNDGRRIAIRNENTTDTTVGLLHIPRVNIVNVQSNLGGLSSYIPLTPEARRVAREAPGPDSRLDFYVCRNFTGFWGLGLNPHADVAEPFRPTAGLRWGCFVAARPLDGGDEFPWVYSHEAGHVLFDAIHVDTADAHSPTALMCQHALSQYHPVDGTKRITDTPVNVRYGFWRRNASSGTDFIYERINAARRFRDRSGNVTEGW